ncbi:MULTISPECIES: GntR family transcriptional regulator [unclassified Microbacterium]|uniref:GntR family transcriptional regulator n=1 Tax=unclassified Microbacterium TaxID=2609290 RepID=UPI00301949B2
MIANAHDTTSAADAAYSDLKERILDGELPGGTMVSEGAIADALGMSRTPVREAFLRLQAEGWMRLYPKRGALVIDVQPRELDDVVEARVLIETDAVRRLVRDAARSDGVAAELGDIVERQRRAHVEGDLSGVADADTAFHATIVEAGGNALLAGFFGSLRDRQRRMVARSLWRRDERTERVLEDHEMLIRLIGDGDVTAFEVALARHIRNTHRELLS